MYHTFPKIADRIIEWGIIFLLVCTPLALPTRYGTVHLWVNTAMELTIFLLVMIWLLKLIIVTLNSKSKVPNPNSEIRNLNISINRFGFVKTPLNIPIILFIILIIFQLTPLPLGILKVLSPSTYDLYKITLFTPWNAKHISSGPALPTDQVSEETNQKLETRNPKPEIRNHQSTIQNLKSEIENWRSISIYRYATKSELIQMLTYIGMFFLVTNTPSLRINRIIVIIICVGFFVSFLGILQKFTGTTKIFWIIDVSSGSRGIHHFGTHINRNHFSGYMAMVIPLSLGLLISRFGNITFYKTMTWRSILTKFESYLLGNILLIFAIMVMISALFLSLSRGGILSFAVATVVFITLIGFSRRAKSVIGKGRILIGSVTVLILAFLFLTWIGIGPILNRLSDFSDQSVSIRYHISKNTLKMAKDFPVFGTGLGTFQYLYPKYDTLEEEKSFYDHAHNDYVELLSDSGLIGLLIVLGGIVVFFSKIMPIWWRGSDPYAKGVTLGGVCGVIAIICNSFADFNLHIPANALFLSFILGLTCNSVNLESIHNDKNSHTRR